MIIVTGEKPGEKLKPGVFKSPVTCPTAGRQMGEASCQIYTLAFPGISSLIPNKTLSRKVGVRKTKHSTKLVSGGSCKLQMPEERGNGSLELQVLLIPHGLGAGDAGLSSPRSPTSVPRFQTHIQPTMCHCERPITAGSVEKPEVTSVKTSCLFSLGSNLGSSEERQQKLFQI